MEEKLVKRCSQYEGTFKMHFLHSTNLQNSTKPLSMTSPRKLVTCFNGMETTCPLVGEKMARYFKKRHL